MKISYLIHIWTAICGCSGSCWTLATASLQPLILDYLFCANWCFFKAKRARKRVEMGRKMAERGKKRAKYGKTRPAKCDWSGSSPRPLRALRTTNWAMWAVDLGQKGGKIRYFFGPKNRARWHQQHKWRRRFTRHRLDTTAKHASYSAGHC